MRRALAVVLPWLLLVPALGQVTPEQGAVKISVAIRAASAERVVAVLAEKTGLPLAVAPAIKDLVLVVKADDMPVADVLKNTAELVGGEWVRSSGKLYLQRDQQFTRRMLKHQRDADIAAIRKANDKNLAEIAKAPVFGKAEADAIVKAVRDQKAKPREQDQFVYSDYQSIQGLTARTPAARAVRRIVATLDPGVLADIEPRVKAVFSSNPTRMQYALPAGVAPIVAQFVREQNVWSENSAELGDPDNPDYTGAGMDGFTWGLIQGRKAFKEAPAKVLVTIARYSSEPAYQVELLCYDQRGKLLVSSNSSVGGSRFDPEGDPEMKADMEAFTKPDEKEPKIPLSEDASAILKAISSGPMYGVADGTVNLPASVRQKILQPEQYDPLSFGASDLLFGLGSVEKRAVFAQPSDQLLLVGGGRTPDFTYRMARILARVSMDVVRRDGVMIARPLNLVRTEATMIPRRLLGEYLRTIDKHGKLSIEQQAEFAFRRGEPSDVQFTEVMLAALVSGSFRASMEASDPEGLRLYGSMTPAQRAQAKQGGVPAGLLNPTQQAMVHRMMYGINSYMSFRGTGAPDDELVYGGIYQQATEAFPNGVPRDALVKLTVTDGEVMIAGARQTSRYLVPERSLGTNEVAYELLRQERPDVFGGGGGMEEYNSVDMGNLSRGTRRIVKLDVDLDPRMTISRQFSESKNLGRAKLSDMSETFRKQVEEQLKQLRAAYGGQGDGSGG